MITAESTPCVVTIDTARHYREMDRAESRRDETEAMIKARAEDVINDMVDDIKYFEEMLLNCSGSDVIIELLHKIWSYEKLSDVPALLLYSVFSLIDSESKKWANEIARKEFG